MTFKEILKSLLPKHSHHDSIRQISKPSERRDAYIQYIHDREWPFHVNRKYCPQLSDDKVLKDMIKDGIVDRKREGAPKTRRTALYLNYDHPKVKEVLGAEV